MKEFHCLYIPEQEKKSDIEKSLYPGFGAKTVEKKKNPQNEQVFMGLCFYFNVSFKNLKNVLYC
jgi:hypothetical protein